MLICWEQGPSLPSYYRRNKEGGRDRKEKREKERQERKEEGRRERGKEEREGRRDKGREEAKKEGGNCLIKYANSENTEKFCSFYRDYICVHLSYFLPVVK